MKLFHSKYSFCRPLESATRDGRSTRRPRSQLRPCMWPQFRFSWKPDDHINTASAEPNISLLYSSQTANGPSYEVYSIPHLLILFIQDLALLHLGPDLSCCSFCQLFWIKYFTNSSFHKSVISPAHPILVDCMTLTIRVCGLGWLCRYSDLLSVRQSADRIQVGGEIFRIHPDGSRGPPNLLHNGHRVFAGGKGAKESRWPSTPSRAEVKKSVQPYLYSLYGPSWPVLERTLPFSNNRCSVKSNYNILTLFLQLSHTLLRPTFYL